MVTFSSVPFLITVSFLQPNNSELVSCNDYSLQGRGCLAFVTKSMEISCDNTRAPVLHPFVDCKTVIMTSLPQSLICFFQRRKIPCC